MPNYLMRDLAQFLSEKSGGNFEDYVLVLQKYFGEKCVRIVSENSYIRGCKPIDNLGAAVTKAVMEDVSPNPMSQQVGGTHYKGDKIQHFDLCMEDKIPWGEASAIKYLMRHQKKNGLQDLLKALHYVEMTIEHYHPGALASHRRDQSPKL